MNAHEALTKAAEICTETGEPPEGRAAWPLNSSEEWASIKLEDAHDAILALRDSLGAEQQESAPIDVRGEICRIVSNMLDHPSEVGIYATTKCYDALEALVARCARSETPQGERAKDAIREANCILNADMPCSRRQELEAELAALRASQAEAGQRSYICQCGDRVVKLEDLRSRSEQG